MRLICGVLATVAAAAFAVSARALELPPLPPLPTLPLPTVPLPTVPAPTVPTPTVPTPTVPTPTVPTPTVPAPPPPAAASPAPQPQPQQPAPTTTAATVTTPAAANAAPPATSASAPMRTASSSRATPRLRIVAHFRLRHRGRILVSVRELAPVCRTLGTYRLHARKGRNALHLPARIKKPGSYEFVGRAHGKKVFSVKARVARGRRVLLGATTTSVCPAPLPLASVVYTRQTPQLHVKSASTRSALPKAIGSSPRGGSPLLRAVSLQDAPASVRPLLFALLALAILLLGTASAPQQVLPATRGAALIAKRRAYLAAAGISLLVIVALVTAAS